MYIQIHNFYLISNFNIFNQIRVEGVCTRIQFLQLQIDIFNFMLTVIKVMGLFELLVFIITWNIEFEFLINKLNTSCNLPSSIFSASVYFSLYFISVIKLLQNHSRDLFPEFCRYSYWNCLELHDLFSKNGTILLMAVVQH